MPSPGTLDAIVCRVPTVRGTVGVDLKRTEEGTEAVITSPGGTSVICGLERSGSDDSVYYDGILIWSGGKAAAGLPEGVSFYGYTADRVCFRIVTGPDDRTFTLRSVSEPSDGDTVTISLTAPENGTIRFAEHDGDTVTVKSGTPVRIIAEPAAGYEFSHFTGAAGGRNAGIEISARRDCTVGAQMAPNRSDYSRLTVYMPEGCDMTVTVNGKKLPFSGGRASAAFLTGTSLDIEAADGKVYSFLNYSGDVSSSGRSVTVGLNGDVRIMINTNELYGPNIAAGAKVSCASSLEAPPQWSASNLTDGDVGTGFTTDVLAATDGVLGKPLVITVDLGSVRDFSLLSLAPRTDTAGIRGGNPGFPVEFTVKISRGGSDYTEIGTFVQENDPAGSVCSYELGDVSARFVRIEVVRTGEYAGDEQIADPYRVQLTELMLRDRK